MKNRIYMITVAVVGTALLFSGCKSPEEKLIDHYDEMSEILKGDDEPLEIMQDLHEYQMDNNAEIIALNHDLIVELQGIEDKGDRADRWEEHAEDLQDARKDFKDDLKDFMKDASEESDVNDWCEDYNKSWKKIEEALGEDKDDELASVSKMIRRCPEEEMASGGGRGGGGGGYPR